MTTLKKSVYVKANLIVLLVALCVAILQGNYATSIASGANGQIQLALLFLIGFVSLFLIAEQKLKGELDAQKGILWTVWLGMLFRAGYVLFYDIYTLQNDEGTYTGFGTDAINNGHIGYIEYIYKFFHLPDMDPYEHFGYYHPPLHHTIEAVWMTIQRLIGVPEKLAFENLQVPTLIYSGLCIVVMLHILEKSGIKEELLSLGMCLFAFHPKLIVLGGSINNDILALLLLLVTIWRTLEWVEDRTYLNIILIALSLGFGMISKLNTAICAFSIALVFFIYFVQVIKEGNRVAIGRTLLEYVVFGVICIPIGLSYIVRNLILFGEKPGIPSPALIPNESVMYTGPYSVWSIIGIPGLADWHAEFPFHVISAASIHNTWVILFQTGLFSESYPADIGRGLLAVCQIAYVASIIAGVLLTIAFIAYYTGRLIGEIKGKDDCLRTTFLLFTYVFMLISFCLYVFKYPYTCSSDFRYMTASLVFTSLGLVSVCDNKKNLFMRVISLVAVFSVVLALAGSVIYFMFYNLSA
ncbi:hypothetical protein bpr_I2504 [Butyrivibrio proteoclasticus B316]|uniref:Dolichyl-phosphate-mannose-protein mannosyltransferase n=1 Tax=Butyrivibrio proteoclasticus (strain ATCC 51982 / DSM 14932 / B316) TaxID=515622 RepID=E0RVS9_BUTPB|nr:hypothetical protein [Butyrivibrio proteoclasticus]ADL35237.1 hypothetical protein bpr_I2504 [Butyrivibrio proteoclasticus B316]